MSWTKRQFINQAFEEIGIASYAYDLTPEQYESALRKLDSMIASWNAKGIRFGYPLPASPAESSLDTDTGCPDANNEAIYQNLGIRLAPAFGKIVSEDLKANAKASYNAMLVRQVVPIPMQFPSTMPKGAGAKHWRNSTPFMPIPENEVRINDEQYVELDE